MITLLLLVACSTSAPPTASDVAYKGGTVQEALDRLSASASPASTEEGDAPRLTDQQLILLEERVARMELIVAQIQQNGTTTATNGDSLLLKQNLPEH